VTVTGDARIRPRSGCGGTWWRLHRRRSRPAIKQ